MARRRRPLREAMTAASVEALLALLRPLPWGARQRVAGTIGRIIVRANPRLRARVTANLAHVMPETSPVERARIAREVGDCFGRTALELFETREFEARRPWREPTGEGVAAVEAALRDGTGAVLVGGHYGAWVAIALWLKGRGAPPTNVYRALGNPRLEARYRASIGVTGTVLPKGRLASRALVRALARGGFVALLVDQYDKRSGPLDFLGKPAPTTLIPAELALKFGVPLIPAYAIRTADGAAIDIRIDAPVARGSPEAMMQAVNDSLAAQVRAQPGQYYWLHRRWSKDLPGMDERERRRKRKKRKKRMVSAEHR